MAPALATNSDLLCRFRSFGIEQMRFLMTKRRFTGIAFPRARLLTLAAAAACNSPLASPNGSSVPALNGLIVASDIELPDLTPGDIYAFSPDGTGKSYLTHGEASAIANG